MGTKLSSSYTPLADPLFSEQSDLNKMGYRITGSTRKERWETLKKAIPVMGLRRIVTIISANVRIKKKQKSSDQQSHYAITEWEYDLSQLKEKYFHGEFKWPNT